MTINASMTAATTGLSGTRKRALADMLMGQIVHMNGKMRIDGGVILFGGERWPMVLVGALLRKPAPLILDEAESALNHVNEALTRRANVNLHGGLTVIFVDHHLSINDQEDLFLELHDGSVFGVVPQENAKLTRERVA